MDTPAAITGETKDAFSCPALVLLDAPCWIRTNDRLLRRQLLYPAELREQALQSCQ